MMGASPGIAGSRQPELEGSFLCRDELEAEWFVRMNNTGGPVDVWAIDDVDSGLLREKDGFSYLRAAVPPDRMILVRSDLPPLR